MQSNTALWSRAHSLPGFNDAVGKRDSLSTIRRGIRAMPVKSYRASSLTAGNHPEKLASTKHICFQSTFGEYNMFLSFVFFFSPGPSNHMLGPSFLYSEIFSKLLEVSIPEKPPEHFQRAIQLGSSHLIPNNLIFSPFTNQNSHSSSQWPHTDVRRKTVFWHLF